METEVKKRFPTNPKMDTTTFLNSKRLNGELYAYLQSKSKPTKDGLTVVLKKDLPKQSDICKVLGIKSVTTYKTYLDYLIDQGYVIWDKDNRRYILPPQEDIYFLVPLQTIQHILDAFSPNAIKIYLYLGQRNKYKPGQYVFTIAELAEHIGVSLTNHTTAYQMINHCLDVLVDSRLIRYTEFFDGAVPKKRLVEFNLQYQRPKIEKESKK